MGDNLKVGWANI